MSLGFFCSVVELLPALCRDVLYAQLQGMCPALPFVPSCHNSCSERKLKFLQVQANYPQAKTTLKLSCSASWEKQELGSFSELPVESDGYLPLPSHSPNTHAITFITWKIPPSAITKHPMYRNLFRSSVQSKFKTIQSSKYLAFFSVLLLSITLTSHIYMSSQHSCSKIFINSAYFTLYYFCFLSNCHWFKEMWPIISHVWNHSSNIWPVNQIPLAIYKLAVLVRFLIAGQLLGSSLRNSRPNSGNFILSVRRMVNLQF